MHSELPTARKLHSLTVPTPPPTRNSSSKSLLSICKTSVKRVLRTGKQSKTPKPISMDSISLVGRYYSDSASPSPSPLPSVSRFPHSISEAMFRVGSFNSLSDGNASTASSSPSDTPITMMNHIITVTESRASEDSSCCSSSSYTTSSYQPEEENVLAVSTGSSLSSLTSALRKMEQLALYETAVWIQRLWYFVQYEDDGNQCDSLFFFCKYMVDIFVISKNVHCLPVNTLPYTLWSLLYINTHTNTLSISRDSISLKQSITTTNQFHWTIRAILLVLIGIVGGNKHAPWRVEAIFSGKQNYLQSSFSFLDSVWLVVCCLPICSGCSSCCF